MQQDKSVKVGLVQNGWDGSCQGQFDKLRASIEKCASQGAQIVCLQELTCHPYFCQSEDHAQFGLAESLDGPVARFASQMARQWKIVLLIGLFERRAPGVFHNSCLVFETDGQLAGVYRKTHVPDDPGFYEKFYFTPGDQAFPAFETSAGTIGVCICWDQWFPEAARLTALAGAQMIFYPTAIGWLAEDKQPYGESQLNAWQTMMKSHAIANGVFVCAPNRTGIESGIEFWGSSFICDPYGNIMDQAPTDTESEIVAELDLTVCETARTHWPFLRDRRTDLYGDLTQKWRDRTPPGRRGS